MKILLTNDDGIKARGINFLFEILSDEHDVTMVAPNKPSNASSHSVTIKKALKVKKLSNKKFAVNGTPTDCVLVGVYNILDRMPDLLISGINSGPNVAEDITYSGTVGAAIEGVLLGIKSVAISFYDEERKDYDFASNFVKKLVTILEKFENKILLNVNIPFAPKGVKITTLGRREYKNVIEKRKNKYIIGGKRENIFLPGTDLCACEEGYVSITPISINLTDYEMVQKIKSWEELF